eukprot:1179766-Prorocentrum_minimum.AAC.1
MVRTTRRPKFAALSLCYHVEFAAKPLTTHAHAARLGHLLLFPGAPPVLRGEDGVHLPPELRVRARRVPTPQPPSGPTQR